MHWANHSYFHARIRPFLQVEDRSSSKFELKHVIRLSTPQFVLAYGTVPPIVCFIVTSLKFTVAEPRPNFLHRCFDGPESSVQLTIKGRINSDCKESVHSNN